MTAAYALARYRQTAASGDVTASNPHEVIAVILRELTHALNVVLAGEEAGQAPRSDHMTRALSAIYVLQSSLDFENGGEIANDLFGLYEFARQQVLKRWRDEPGAEIAAARDALLDILDAWQQIGTAGATGG